MSSTRSSKRLVGALGSLQRVDDRTIRPQEDVSRPLWSVALACGH